MTVKVHEIWPIENICNRYLGWPTITRTKSGDLFVIYSGGRMHHVCPFGQLHMIRSSDNGKTWTWPRVLVDGPLDDRDGGVMETAKGTLIAAWFTSMAWSKTLHERPDAMAAKYSQAEVTQWKLAAANLTDDVVEKELGIWVIRSTDGGLTWSEKIDSVAGSPHGPILLSDGRLLYPGKCKANPSTSCKKGSPYGPAVGAAESRDDGKTWQWISDITPMPGHNSADYHELHGVEASDGRIVVHIRNHNETHRLETLQTDSTDGGKTWSPVRSIGLIGYPAHLMKTSTGRLISTVGVRYEPRGTHVAWSDDNGQTWSPQTALNTDSAGDLGYPSTVEIEPGVFLTLWYDTQGQTKTYLRLARWSFT